MIKLSDLLEAVKEKFSKDHFQAEPAPFKKPKDESEKHNDTYYQAEPVPFKKPEEVSDKDDDKMPKPEKEQKEVMDRMEKQAHVANPSSTDFYKQLHDTFHSAVNEMSEIEEDTVLGAGMSKEAKARDTEESDREYIKQRQEREKKKAAASNSGSNDGK